MPPKRKTPAPVAPPAKRAAKPRVRGNIRKVPCLGCLKSCLAGKQTETGANGACYDLEPKGSRCYKCASGHSCKPIPVGAFKPAMKFLAARDKNNKPDMEFTARQHFPYDC
ncbi:hypothetical protein BN1708_011841 [Verticillium longisporum]|uniref:Uncharacterized protein n=1 Tax=Verticillium longisporum TaxID=100787 RepID=A0A0G4L477_VERLO|nr:hypothetical protein BN1708_011841 [Verticillium longisporum]